MASSISFPQTRYVSSGAFSLASSPHSPSRESSVQAHRRRSHHVLAAQAKDDAPAVTFYTAATPNSFKVSILLEELGLQYNTRKMDLRSKEQKKEWFLRINPNGRVPALVDHQNGDYSIFESGAILMYLEKRYGDGSLYPQDDLDQFQLLSWIMFEISGIGPTMVQLNHFIHNAPEKVLYSQKRYYLECKRLCSVLEMQLSDGREYLVGGKYSLADISNFSWIVYHPMLGIDLNQFPHVKSWKERIYARDAVKKGLDVPKEFELKEVMGDDARIKEKIEEVRKKLDGVTL